MESKTLWVKLTGADLARANEMRDEECRSYSSLLRAALKHYYDTKFLPPGYYDEPVKDELAV